MNDEVKKLLKDIRAFCAYPDSFQAIYWILRRLEEFEKELDTKKLNR